MSPAAGVGRRRALLKLGSLAVRENDESLIDLEERLMHQERLLERLNEVVTAQQEQIELLTRQLARLRDQLAQGPAEDVDEPPPHY